MTEVIRANEWSKEMLLVVESVSLEKGVSKEVIFDAMESALAMATKKRYSEEAEFRVTIDRDTGEYDTVRTWKVVNYEDEEEPEHERTRCTASRKPRS